MYLNELIKAVMKVEKITQEDLAKMTGKSQTNISGMLSRESIRGDIAIELLAAMGYEIEAVKKITVGNCTSQKDS